MSNQNQCNFTGRVGNDPDIHTFDNGDIVANLSIAVNSKWKDKVTGDKKQSTEWINLVGYKAVAKLLSEWVKKGDMIGVTCIYKLKKWEDNEGNSRSMPQFIINRLEFLGSSNRDSTSRPNNQSSTPSNSQSYNDFQDDDIPF